MSGAMLQTRTWTQIKVCEERILGSSIFDSSHQRSITTSESSDPNHPVLTKSPSGRRAYRAQEAGRDVPDLLILSRPPVRDDCPTETDLQAERAPSSIDGRCLLAVDVTVDSWHCTWRKEVRIRSINTLYSQHKDHHG